MHSENIKNKQMQNNYVKYWSLLVLLLVMLLFGNCEKKEDYSITNINHNTLMILGHRGMGDHFRYPGNTLESILPVLDIGVDGSEIDVQITADSVLVLFHNEKLNNRTQCSGKIFDLTWEEIRNCNYSAIQANVKLISVDELFSSIENLKEFYFSFDCKLDPDNAFNISYRKVFLRAIKNISNKYSMTGNIFIEGDLNFLLLAKELGLSNKGFLIGSSTDAAIENNIFGVGATVNTSTDSIEYAHDNGIYVMMWGAKTDIGNKQALRLNPDILQTDKPIPLLMLLDRMNYGATVP